MANDPVEWGRVRETIEIDRTGEPRTIIVAPFWIGKHGPFTERFTREEWLDAMTRQTRVDAIRRTLDTLPK